MKFSTLTKLKEKEKWAIFLFISLLFIYLLNMGGHFYSADGVTRYAAARSLVEDHDLSLKEFGRYYPADKLYGATEDKKRYYGNGRQQLQYILLIPLYIFGDFVAYLFPRYDLENTHILFSYAFNSIVTALTALIFYYICLQLGYTLQTSILTTLIYGLATMTFPYANFLNNQVLGVFFILLSFFFLISYRKKRENRWLIPFAFGLVGATFSRREFAIIGVFFSVYIISWELRRFYLKRIIFMIFFILSLAYGYNYLHFKNLAILNTVNHFWLGFISTIKGSGRFTTPLLTGLYGNLLSPGKSIFLYSPILILALFFGRAFYKKNRLEALLSFIIIVSFILFISKLDNWSGNWCWGNRHLLIIIPFLTLPLAGAIEKWESLNFSIKTIFLYLLMLSIIIQIVGVSIDWQDYLRWASSEFGGEQGVGLTIYNWSISPILGHLEGLIYRKDLPLDFWWRHPFHQGLPLKLGVLFFLILFLFPTLWLLLIILSKKWWIWVSSIFLLLACLGFFYKITLQTKGFKVLRENSDPRAIILTDTKSGNYIKKFHPPQFVIGSDLELLNLLDFLKGKKNEVTQTLNHYLEKYNLSYLFINQANLKVNYDLWSVFNNYPYLFGSLYGDKGYQIYKINTWRLQLPPIVLLSKKYIKGGINLKDLKTVNIKEDVFNKLYLIALDKDNNVVEVHAEINKEKEKLKISLSPRDISSHYNLFLSDGEDLKDKNNFCKIEEEKEGAELSLYYLTKKEKEWNPSAPRVPRYSLEIDFNLPQNREVSFIWINTINEGERTIAIETEGRNYNSLRIPFWHWERVGFVEGKEVKVKMKTIGRIDGLCDQILITNDVLYDPNLSF
ncbi:MAG: hypothetical protein V1872_13210 [bacterium]